MAHEAETSGPSDPDPEISYYQGAIFAYAGKKEAAFHMLKTAIEQNYCAYSNLLSDPLLRGLHSDRQFDELLTAATPASRRFRPPARRRASDSGRIEPQSAANSSFPAQSISKTKTKQEHQEKSCLSSSRHCHPIRMKMLVTEFQVASVRSRLAGNRFVTLALLASACFV